MNKHQNSNSKLPIKGNIIFIYIASLLIVLLMAAASIAGLRYRTLLYPTHELLRAFVANDAINLFFGVPLLLGSMWLTRRGKWIGLLCWPGALFFVFYNYTAYVFAMPLNWAFLLDMLLVMLSMYTLIALIANIDGNAVREKLTGVVPEKFAGGVLTGLGLLFALRVIGVVIGTISSHTPLGETELAVNIADFLTTPAWVIGGILLWRRKEPGYVTGLGLLFQSSMLFISLIIFLLLQPILSATSLAIGDVVVISVMGLVCFVPFALFVRGVLARQI